MSFIYEEVVSIDWFKGDKLSITPLYLYAQKNNIGKHTHTHPDGVLDSIFDGSIASSAGRSTDGGNVCQPLDLPLTLINLCLWPAANSCIIINHYITMIDRGSTITYSSFEHPVESLVIQPPDGPLTLPLMKLFWSIHLLLHRSVTNFSRLQEECDVMSSLGERR